METSSILLICDSFIGFDLPEFMVLPDIFHYSKIEIRFFGRGPQFPYRAFACDVITVMLVYPEL